jgi:hypothetical protein
LSEHRRGGGRPREDPARGVGPRGRALRVARYRSRGTFGQRWGGYLSLVLLVGLVGGVALGALASARRTQSSYSTYLASTNPSDLSLGTALFSPALGFTTGYDAALVRTIAHLPHVTRVESYSSIYGSPLQPNGQPTRAGYNANINVDGSIDGEYFSQDRVTVVAGRMADPRRPDQLMMTVAAARELDLHVGDRVSWGTYANTATSTPSNTPPPPAVRTAMTVVGLVALNNAIVQDDIDAQSAQTVILTPALTKELVDCCASYSFSYLQLSQGSRYVPAVEREIERVMPAVLPYDFYDTALTTAKAEHAIKPEAIALAVFGAIAALAAVLIGGQLIGRQLRQWSPDGRVLRSLGADPAVTLADALVGILTASAVGALLAGVVAVALSPLSPLGPVRPYAVDPGIAFDWTVLGFGTMALVVVLWTLAVVFGIRGAPHRVTRSFRSARTTSKLADVAAAAGAPVPAVTGVRFALQPDARADAVPMRSAILGATLAVVVVIATVVFGSSLDSLVGRPALYGWNWNYELSAGGGVAPVPAALSTKLLGQDQQVAAWSGYYFANLQIDGLTVPVLGATAHSSVAPPLLAGHGFEATNQIVLGAETMAQLGKSVGAVVRVAYGATRPTTLRIVGTATMPTVGIGGITSHLTVGTGAIVPYQLIPPSVRNQFGLSPPGPNALFVRLRPGVDPVSARRALNRIDAEMQRPTNYQVTLQDVQRPAEIVNYRSMGTTPALLGLALALGATSALGLTLVASVRRRRREFAMLKTLGFTRRQLAASVAWQATISVGIGVVIGVPCGIVAGRFLWDLFADQIYVVPDPAVPIALIVGIGLGALVAANLVAALPGWVAARTRTALLLRAE